MNEYQEFLKSKERKTIEAGFKISDQQLNRNLFDFQRYIVCKALGIGSEVYKSIELGRYGIGIELKDKYFETAVKNARRMTEKQLQLSLF